jgi:hypothetical protein
MNSVLLLGERANELSFVRTSDHCIVLRNVAFCDLSNGTTLLNIGKGSSQPGVAFSMINRDVAMFMMISAMFAHAFAIRKSLPQKLKKMQRFMGYSMLVYISLLRSFNRTMYTVLSNVRDHSIEVLKEILLHIENLSLMIAGHNPSVLSFNTVKMYDNTATPDWRPSEKQAFKTQVDISTVDLC